MRDLKGFTSGKGRIGTVRFYNLKGLSGTFASTVGGATREQVETLPSMQQVRLLNCEWKGVCMMTRRVLQGLGYISNELNTSYMPARLNKVFKAMQVDDVVHSKGERSILPVDYKVYLEGFELNPSASFTSVFIKPLTVVWTNRKSATITPGIITPNQLNPPLGATHYQLTLLVFSLAPAIRSSEGCHYHIDDVVNDIAYNDSGYFSVSNATTPSALNAALNYAPTMPSEIAAVAVIECHFFQLVAGNYNPIITGSAAKILSIT